MHTCILSYWLKRSWHSCPGQVNAGSKQNHTQHAPSTKMECDCLSGWIKKNSVTYAKISPKMVNPRDVAGECRRRKKDWSQHMVRRVTSTSVFQARIWPMLEWVFQSQRGLEFSGFCMWQFSEACGQGFSPSTLVSFPNSYIGVSADEVMLNLMRFKLCKTQ